MLRNKFAVLIISVFTIVNSQNALYNGGDFVTSLFTPMSVPASPYTLDQVNAILSLAPTDTNSILNVATSVPCIFISKNQNVGYRLVTTQSSGYAFLSSNSLCPCNSCFRIVSCCGSIRNSDGTITPCYTPIPCQGNGTCLRNYECFGVSTTSPYISTTNDLNSFVNSTIAQLSTPCFKISPTTAGSNGFTLKVASSGTGFQITTCNSTISSVATTTACLRLQSCCASQGKACYTAVPCCVPVNGTVSKDCLSITRCDSPS